MNELSEKWLVIEWDKRRKWLETQTDSDLGLSLAQSIAVIVYASFPRPGLLSHPQYWSFSTVLIKCGRTSFPYDYMAMSRKVRLDKTHAY